MRDSEAKALAFVGSRLVLRETAQGLRLPTLDEVEAAFERERLEVGRVDVRVTLTRRQVHTFCFDDDEPLPAGYRCDGLRVAYHSLADDDFRAAGAARQIIEWRRTTRFCTACASPLVLADAHDALACSSCGRLHFPPISPAVIVLVQRGEQVLLGRSPRFQQGVYSTLAGFVEPGESLEECVHREIFEEVGVRVQRLRYFGSQPHPFPHSLMVGFVADWLEGSIRIDEDEIEDARWFHADDLPVLPHPMSIARALIEDFVRRVG
ncbi:MAG: NAD(+) diphosphatase [Gemmatimonadetes bacterium]|nr:NAD(+) diphosphatase [Gemmatimonadota bacterium]NNF13502.1 NAD(+) diphosphatase [Gemmatimonadota bacterium]